MVSRPLQAVATFAPVFESVGATRGGRARGRLIESSPNSNHMCRARVSDSDQSTLFSLHGSVYMKM